ncbi:FCD domain-containing protein, partial [Klebsiella pneumoniae]|nr:FCD domain-containing protein [Klebsiella pneumoniae]
GDSPPCASDEHQAVIDALRAGDRETAVREMIEHLDELEGQLALEETAAPEVNLRQALAGL